MGVSCPSCYQNTSPETPAITINVQAPLELAGASVHFYDEYFAISGQDNVLELDGGLRVKMVLPIMGETVIANTVQVFRNGLIQPATLAWLLSGDTIMLTTAGDAGDLFLVRFATTVD